MFFRSFYLKFTQAPSITSDGYARKYFGYTGPSCSSFANGVLPTECSLGSAKAANTASTASFVTYFISFFSSPLLGSLSDVWGRRG